MSVKVLRVDSELHKQIKVEAAKAGKTMKEWLESLIKKDLKGRTK